MKNGVLTLEAPGFKAPWKDDTFSLTIISAGCRVCFLILAIAPLVVSSRVVSTTAVISFMFQRSVLGEN